MATDKEEPKWVVEGVTSIWMGVNILAENGHDNIPALLRRIANDLERRQEREKKTN